MERDDIIEYSIGAQHSEEAGAKIRKRIWVITGWLSLITTVEVVVGALFSKSNPDVTAGTWEMIKYGYLILTVIKARMIILEFMHLGHERKSMRKTILIPYIFFILYLIFICINEAIAVSDINFDVH